MSTAVVLDVELTGAAPAGPYLTARLAADDEALRLVGWLTDQQADTMCDLIWDAPSPYDWPSHATLAALTRIVVSGLRVERPVRLTSADPQATLAFLRFLRDATSFGLRVQWTCAPEPSVDTRWLVHLPPPADDADDPQLRAWRDLYQFGQLFWRNGPGFVQIKNTRPTNDQARFTLDDPETVETFQLLQEPTPESALAARPALLQAAHDMAAEWLVLPLAGWWLALPYRIKKWPIPYLAI